VKLYLHYPNTPSWRGAQLKKAQGQLHLFTYCSSSAKWTSCDGHDAREACVVRVKNQSAS